MKSQRSKQTDIVVIGGGYAGMLATLRLAGKVRKSNAQITLVNGSAHLVERVRMHQLATGQALKERPIAQLLPKTNTRFCIGWATEIDPKGQTVQVQTPNGNQSIPYDYLMYAPGSATDRESVPGVAQLAFDVGSENSSTRLRQALTDIHDQDGRVLVVGGGLTGIEAATEIAESYPSLQVTLATRGKLGENLSQRGSQYLKQIFDQMRIHVVEDAAVTRLTTGYAEYVVGGKQPFDVCIWAGSFRAPALAHESGFQTDTQGRIQVDETLRSISYPNVYAVGDAAATSLRMGCATAMPMGAYAADHLAAQIVNKGSIPPFQFGYLVQCISLGRHRGLVQFVEADDTPLEKIITGWPAARVKEIICRFTIWALHVEKLFPGSYLWSQGNLERPSTWAAEYR